MFWNGLSRKSTKQTVALCTGMTELSLYSALIRALDAVFMLRLLGVKRLAVALKEEPQQCRRFQAANFCLITGTTYSKHLVSGNSRLALKQQR